MGLQYENLDREVRQVMVGEILSATASNTLYRSKILTDEGHEAWPDLLRSAAVSHDDDWLAIQLRRDGMMLPHTPTKRGSGKKKVNAHVDSTKLAEGQFNFYYCLAVCVVAMASGEDSVEIYRARESQNPRSSSAALVGTLWPAVQLLTDLRQSGGIETAIGLNRPNSGLSVRRTSALGNTI